MKTYKLQYLMKLLLLFFLLVSAESYGFECVIRDKNGDIKRSQSAVKAFKKLNPCPATGKITGKCHGYVVDHIHPLCHCGDDKPYNMQWQTVSEAKGKDK